jgi:HAD superfamily hydrolase (TIGR01549 family)
MSFDHSLIKLLCFDLGGVLVRLNTGVGADLLDLCPPDRRGELAALIRDDFVHAQNEFSLNERYQLGHHSTEDYIGQLLPLFEGKLSEAALREKAISVIAGEYETVSALLPTLRNRYRLGCYSNTHDLHWRHMHSRFSWFEHFDFKLASHLTGIAKPHPDSFLAICRVAGVGPAECLFIDDRLVNIEGAKAVGMKALLCTTPEELVVNLLGLK